MFIGHFGVALAAKRATPRVNLGTLFLAAQLADTLWPLFLLLGIEEVRISPGITKATPLDFYFYPFSHSLAMLTFWGLGFAALHFLAKHYGRTALLLGGLVVSHWFLDVLVHRPDMPLVPGFGPRYGLGLWNSIPITMALEIGLFVIGIYFYFSSTRARDAIGSFAVPVLLTILSIGWLGALFGPPPPSVRALVISSLIAPILLLPLAVWGDRHRVAISTGIDS